MNYIDIPKGTTGSRAGTSTAKTADGMIKKPHLAEILKLGKTTIDKGIAILKKYRYIERIDSNKSGYWKVLK